MSNISLIIQREFNERVRKKSFIITTILMPVLMLALMVAPALIMRFSRGETKTIAVIDDSGLVAPKLADSEEIRFTTTDKSTDEARREFSDLFGVLWIGSDILENPSAVKLYANSSSRSRSRRASPARSNGSSKPRSSAATTSTTSSRSSTR